MFEKVDPNIKLDEQQRGAILNDADNLLVVAGAGSGKTTTMIAKVKYLVDKCGYQQSEIAVLSFTKKVTEEIEKTLHDKFGLKGVDVHTFHSLGLKIIRASGENFNGIVDEKMQYNIFSNYIKDELFVDKEKFKLFEHSFSKFLRFGKGWENSSNFEEYHNSIYNENLIKSGFDLKTYNHSQIKKRRAYKKSIRGEYLASKEEVDIANFLYKNGIDYEYERKYNDPKKLLRPDFFISQLGKENYIEHFGVDQEGNNYMYDEETLRSYLKTMERKTEFYNQGYNKNLFIITQSKYKDGTYLSHLKDQLIKKGYQFNRLSDEEIFTTLRDTNKDGYINTFIEKMLIPFINLFKQRNFNVDNFDNLTKENTGILKDQLIVMRDFYINYQKKLAEMQKIDFNDMIIKAYTVMPNVKEKSLGVDYKYLIIDEYQDISSQRFNLVERMSKLFDAKIMAVGDDWQSIFGFSGARIDLFKDFDKNLENAESVPIENTYRNSQELIDIAGEFILKNEYQVKKKLKSSKHLNNPVEIIIYDDSDFRKADIQRSKIVNDIINHIYSRHPKSKILLLGRYRKDIYTIQNDNLFNIIGERITSKKYPKANLKFLTIHKAKGLGCDHCILLNLSDEKYGFPSKIEDEPLVKLIRPKNDESIDYAEERRLFYVALTRTKNKVYLLVPKSKQSIFVNEIEEYKNVEKKFANQV
ncbi:MAG: UvrD-helicase domain-containing protein [Bacilli bacterium]|nr:UvrD-helicase domain-containing protein [Bacilli bacterium]MDD4719182.1 UvrD-helicase domain-containing protein [Bacilli bacterium]